MMSAIVEAGEEKTVSTKVMRFAQAGAAAFGAQPSTLRDTSVARRASGIRGPTQLARQPLRYTVGMAAANRVPKAQASPRRWLCFGPGIVVWAQVELHPQNLHAEDVGHGSRRSRGAKRL